MVIAAATGATPQSAGAAFEGPVATASLKNQAGDVVGEVSFQQLTSGVQVKARVGGLSPTADFHGFHIHANGTCDGDFTSAGGHWNPAGATHGDHQGDMPVLYAGADGTAVSNATLDAFTVDQLLGDAGGVAVIVHAGRDNYANIPAARYSTSAGPGPDTTTNNTGDAGARLACGVIGATTPSATGGYWMAAADGGIFTSGAAPFAGSEAGSPLNSPIIGVAPSASGAGYYLAASDGGVFAHGDASFEGSAGGLPLNGPIVAIAAPRSHARAVLTNAAGVPAGHVSFRQTDGAVKVTAYVTGLEPQSEFHGFHIHANGACAGDFVTSAGGHWNPAGATHGAHQGDLPVLYADANGVARATYTTDAFTVTQLLADDGGVSVIVHAGRDNYGNIPMDRYSTSAGPGADTTTKNTGDAGARSACGVVQPTGSTTASGYWLAARDGGVFAFGDAPFAGSMGGSTLNAPLVAVSPTTTGDGYWLVARDGGVFTFGDAPFLGSAAASPLNSPIVAMHTTPTGHGYALFAADGGVFTYGDASFQGSLGAVTLNKPIVGAATTESGHGYWMFASDGGVFTFGDAGFLGSQGDRVLNSPVVAGAAHSG